MAKRLLENGERWLRQKLKLIDEVSVAYRRGEETITLTATIGKTEREQQNHQDGFVGRAQVRDFLIDCDQILFDGVVSDPQTDDAIIETENGTAYVYRITSPGGSEPAFNYSTRQRLTWRIHTELIDEYETE